MIGIFFAGGLSRLSSPIHASLEDPTELVFNPDLNMWQVGATAATERGGGAGRLDVLLC